MLKGVLKLGFKSMRASSLRPNSPGAIFIFMALLCAVIAGVLVVNALRMAVPTVPVIIARADIEPGQTITENMLDIRNYPRAVLPDDRITGKNFDNMIGRHARTAIAAGDPVRARHIAEFTPEGGTVAARLTLIKRADWRAVALPAEASAGLNVEPGDRVDIIGTLDALDEGEQITTSKVLVWAAPVIYTPSGEEEKEKGGIVVALSPPDAERVSLAVAEGKILAVLNPLGKVSGQQSKGTTVHEIFASP